MALITATPKSGDGPHYELDAGDNLVVGRGVTVLAFTGNAIASIAGSHTVTIAGRVEGDDIGVVLNTGGSRTNTLIIERSGVLIGHNQTAAEFNGQSASLVNRGRLIEDEGVDFNWAGTGNATATVVNAGVVHFTDGGFDAGDNVSLTFTNTGRVFYIDESFISGGASRDVLVNRGLIYSDVSLNAGNDLYDGRNGYLAGDIFGGEGNDVFLAGRGTEYFDGSSGFDKVDYRSGDAVVLRLDSGLAGGKAAAGDVHNSVEWAVGSATGADRIFGGGFGERLVGLGGRDSLVGNAGNDTLIGGKGRDLINAGGDLMGETDQIVFGALAHGGDRVINFSDTDEVLISLRGFGLGGTPGGLEATPDRYHEGTTNKAQDAQDRFIFRTTDNTLWFDKDGSKGQFGPVLIASFDGAVGFDASNITLF